MIYPYPWAWEILVILVDQTYPLIQYNSHVSVRLQNRAVSALGGWVA